MEGEARRRLVLEVVRLVDDQVVVGRQDVAAGRHVGEQQGVVDDEDVRGLGALAGALQKAGAVLDEGTLGLDAGRVLGGEAGPGGVVAAVEVELCAVAGLGRAQPDQEARHEMRFFLRLRSGVPGGGPALQAEVVAAALERGDAQGLRLGLGQQGFDDRQVLVDELLLQADGVGGDDDALVAAQGLQRRGQ